MLYRSLRNPYASEIFNVFLQDLTSFTSWTSQASIKHCLQPSSVGLLSQLSADPDRKSVSSPAAPSSLPALWKQEASVLQKEECKRKQFLKEDMNNEKRENVTLKRKHGTPKFSGRASKHVAWEEEAAEVKAYLNCGNPRACGNHFCDVRYLDDLEQSQVMEVLQEAEALVVTLMYEDGSTQLGGARVSPQHWVCWSAPLLRHRTPLISASDLVGELGRRFEGPPPPSGE